jgi:hypothetical protein
MAHLPIKGLSDLLSELVAAGFERLSVAMQATDQSRSGQFAKVGQAYVAFAVGNTALFQLMSRVEKLDAGHERLHAARRRLRRNCHGHDKYEHPTRTDRQGRAVDLSEGQRHGGRKTRRWGGVGSRASGGRARHFKVCYTNSGKRNAWRTL